MFWLRNFFLLTHSYLEEGILSLNIGVKKLLRVQQEPINVLIRYLGTTIPIFHSMFNSFCASSDKKPLQAVWTPESGTTVHLQDSKCLTLCQDSDDVLVIFFFSLNIIFFKIKSTDDKKKKKKKKKKKNMQNYLACKQFKNLVLMVYISC